jgi:hypothetical protein
MEEPAKEGVAARKNKIALSTIHEAKSRRWETRSVTSRLERL